MNEMVTLQNRCLDREMAKKVFEHLDIQPATIKDYQYRIGAFLDFVQSNGLNNNTFLDYKRELKERGDYAIATKNKYLISARVYLQELNRLGVIPIDITNNVKCFQQGRKHKREGLNDHEIWFIAEFLKESTNSPDILRVRSIMSLMALQGLREIELVRLDVTDLDFVSQVAYVHGKGRDDKEAVSLHPETVKNLKAYMEAYKVASGPLLFNLSNNMKGQRLTTRGLRRIVMNLFGELGIDKVPHGIRHWFTTTLLKSYGGDLLQVARHTRHRSLETLQVYDDRIRQDADLPKFFGTFNGVQF